MNQPSSALDQAQAPVAKPSIAQFIKTMQPEIQRALPRGLDADRVARLALTAVRQSELAAKAARKPQNSLAACSPESFAGSLLTAAALGLEPNTPAGECYLVPYKGEATLIIGYQGYTKLFYQSPLAASLDAHAVHENDEFDFAYGLAPYLKHRPTRGDRGDIIYYYAVGTLNTGASAFVVLTPDEIKALRGGRVGSSGNIPDPMRWMERKTALRQLFKTLPKSAQLVQALDADERTGRELQATLITEREDVRAIESELTAGGEQA